MIRTLLLILLTTPCFAQETVTFRIDSIGRQNWQFTTTTTYQRQDSTLSQRSESVKLGNRKQAKDFVVLHFKERISQDSTALEDVKRRLAALKTARQAILSELNKPKATLKQ